MKPYMEEAVRLIVDYYNSDADEPSEQFAKELLQCAEFDDADAPDEAVERMFTVCDRVYSPQTGEMIMEVLDELLSDIDRRRYEFTDPDCNLSQKEIEQEVIRVENQRNAVLVLARIGRKGKPKRSTYLEELYKRCQSHAKGLRKALDPYDVVRLPEAPPWRVWHKRDFAREEYVYHARTVEKKTFVEIGRELGISPQVANKCFYNADRERRLPSHNGSRPERVAKRDLKIISLTIEWKNHRKRHPVYDVAKEVTNIYRQNNMLKTGQYNALGNAFIQQEIVLSDEEIALLFESAAVACEECKADRYYRGVEDKPCWIITVTYNSMVKCCVRGDTIAPSSAQRIQEMIKNILIRSDYKGEPLLLSC